VPAWVPEPPAAFVIALLGGGFIGIGIYLAGSAALRRRVRREVALLREKAEETA
jgi:hypothetical protein